MNLSNKRIFITGAAGFIGANLTRKFLELGAVIHAVVRPGGNIWRITEIQEKLNLHFIDVMDTQNILDSITKIQPQVILNLASEPGHPSTPGKRLDLLKTSVMGTAHLLEAARKTDLEMFIQYGSSLEYGSHPTPLRESMRLKPNTFRGVGKASASLLVQQYALSGLLPAVIIRPFSVYGYWESPIRLIPSAIISAFINQEFHLTKPGYVHDPIFIEDLVNASLLTLSATNINGKVVNIGSGIQWKNEDILDLIQSITGHKIKIIRRDYPPSPSDTDHWVADIKLARKLLNWTPQYTLSQGLEKNIQWMKPRLEQYINLQSSRQG